MEEKIYDLDRVFFNPGDKVICHKVDNSPVMYVLRKKELTFKDGDEKAKTLQGIVCRWFTTDGTLLEGIFNTKDIKKLN